MLPWRLSDMHSTSSVIWLICLSFSFSRLLLLLTRPSQLHIHIIHTVPLPFRCHYRGMRQCSTVYLLLTPVHHWWNSSWLGCCCRPEQHLTQHQSRSLIGERSRFLSEGFLSRVLLVPTVQPKIRVCVQVIYVRKWSQGTGIRLGRVKEERRKNSQRYLMKLAIGLHPTGNSLGGHLSVP